ncbi:hypothetical protein H8356DRAFT_1712154 [Neocallimastix lanati (nom. inval.)]|jgi:hypothetical protein|uniref:Uncharacterized protein n=1 Tax=Neocallimastix californiae TaxID=1754190 RepID=A0A1Y2BQY1_9FUNG|nr:hypothetical protein H8356DRAFT_1712154 [Neocallimastix sp. JGI-2020a]ORY37150.1 hypothetical protein LY90DRAFT_704712 [Neocallimastix californiae]|eukprot:ORY37150.1 hypothetical protein LY90DRAFT_704712 [Neocallimastix californiae]
MYNINDILVDKDSTSFVRIENVSNNDKMNTCCRARILAVDSNTGYPIHLTCACIDIDNTTGYSVDLNCKFQPWLDTIEKESEKEEIEEIINKLKNINWEISSYEEEEDGEEYEEYENESDNESINEQGEEEINNNLYIKTLRRKLLDDSEDDDATLVVPNSPNSPIITLSTNEINSSTEVSTQ